MQETLKAAFAATEMKINEDRPTLITLDEAITALEEAAVNESDLNTTENPNKTTLVGNNQKFYPMSHGQGNNLDYGGRRFDI